MNKDELYLKNRFLELARTAANKHCMTHSVFLNLHEQTIFRSMGQNISEVRSFLYGGYDFAERRVVCFVPHEKTENKFDFLSFVRISPVMEKFSDELTHRDYLGAIMNLGFERHMIGDICVDGKAAHVIVLKSMEETILELDYVKHTKVKVEPEEARELKMIVRTKKQSVNMASARLDVAIAAVYRLSRKEAGEYFDEEKVFVNAKLCTNRSYMIKTEEIVSVRGLGRFRYLGNEHMTKKGRLSSEVEIFI